MKWFLHLGDSRPAQSSRETIFTIPEKPHSFSLGKTAKKSQSKWLADKIAAPHRSIIHETNFQISRRIFFIVWPDARLLHPAFDLNEK